MVKVMDNQVMDNLVVGFESGSFWSVGQHLNQWATSEPTVPEPLHSPDLSHHTVSLVRTI